MKLFKKALIPAATAAMLAAAGAANADLASWYVNYADASDANGSPGATVQAASNLTDEYKYTAESLVMFNDNDGSGGISGGDTFLDVIAFRIDQLFYQGNNNLDADNFFQNAQISGSVVATGIQIDPLNYVVTSAEISFYFDNPTAGGTAANFQNLAAFVDGVLVQTGIGKGAGVNAALIPDGAININFELTDVLSTIDPDYDVFELFDPFATLSQITFTTDSNNQQCGAANCGSTVASLEALFGVDVDNFDFHFHTRSDGSALKEIPEPASVALLGLGLLGAGAVRRRMKRA